MLSGAGTAALRGRCASPHHDPTGVCPRPPDKWTSTHHLTIPELLQHDFDLVIVDEVDSVQKALDDVFAPRSPIIGRRARRVCAEHRASFLGSVARAQRRPVPQAGQRKMQSNFFAFFRLIGTIYAIVQNDVPDSARSTRTRRSLPEASSMTCGGAGTGARETAGRPHVRQPEFAREFIEVIKVTSAIKGYSRASSIAEDDQDGDGGHRRARLRRQGFQGCRRRPCARSRGSCWSPTTTTVLVADVEEKLDRSLAVFNAVRDDGLGGDRIDRRKQRPGAHARDLVADLALAHYNWLIKTQSAGRPGFPDRREHLLGQSSNLLEALPDAATGPTRPVPLSACSMTSRRNEERTTKGGNFAHQPSRCRPPSADAHARPACGRGQAGPHVLMLSGTSWGGREQSTQAAGTTKLIDAASPTFDVQVPVKGS